MADPIRDAVQQRVPAMNEMRRKLHAMPELGFQENATAAYIAERLSTAGLEVHKGIGKTGVVGVLRGSSDGPQLMIRADIDGLPVIEKTGLEFASKNGNMHACGHDGHITMALQAAGILSGMKSNLKGTVVFAFQPAEEIVSGAIAMDKDGLFDRWKSDRVIGTHLWNQLPTGFVGVNLGTVFASADAIRIVVTGKGGHGAMPHMTVDPVATAAQVVATAQTIVSRELPPNEMGVVTFGQIHGGSAPNVIADNVVVEGTVRAYKPEIREQILASLKRITSNVASAMRASTTFEHLHGAPPVINDPDVAAWTAGIAAQVVGEENVDESPPVSVGDDMAEFLNRIPGTYFLLGAAKPGTEGHHNARFDFDPACLPTGTEIFVRSALDFLS
jgi:amidohydrolase